MYTCEENCCIKSTCAHFDILKVQNWHDALPWAYSTYKALRPESNSREPEQRWHLFNTPLSVCALTRWQPAPASKILLRQATKVSRVYILKPARSLNMWVCVCVSPAPPPASYIWVCVLIYAGATSLSFVSGKGNEWRRWEDPASPAAPLAALLNPFCSTAEGERDAWHCKIWCLPRIASNKRLIFVLVFAIYVWGQAICAADINFCQNANSA